MPMNSWGTLFKAFDTGAHLCKTLHSGGARV